MIPRTPKAIEAMHRLYQAHMLAANAFTTASPPPRHARATAIFGAIVCGVLAGGFGGHYLMWWLA